MKTVYKNKVQCCGCSACYAACPHNAIRMVNDDHGFLYPVINQEQCIDCHLCEKVCNIDAPKRTEPNQIKMLAAKNIDKDVRTRSSSGGIFSVFANEILKDGGTVYGASYSSDFAVKHIRIIAPDELYKIRGSKYVQSNLGDSFENVKRDLQSGHKVLFSGTPCQVDGLYSFLQRNYDNLYTIDVICHGVPSQRLFSEHLKYIEGIKKKRIKEYNFRSKALGWHRQTDEASFFDGTSEYGTPLVQSFKDMFFKGYMMRSSCYSCYYSNLHRIGDISLGDFWGIEAVAPAFNDNEGVSLVLVNSEKGNKLLSKLSAYLTYQETESYGVQPHLEHAATKPENETDFWDDYENKGYAYVVNRYSKYNTKGRIKYIIKILYRKIKK